MRRSSLRAAALLAVMLVSLLTVSPGPMADGLPQSLIVKNRGGKISLGASRSRGVFMRKVVGGRVVCREATAAEARVFTERGRDVPLRRLSPAEAGLVSAQQTGLQIVLRGTPQLDTFPEAKEAFLRAAARWQEIINTSITVIIDVDFGTKLFGETFDDDTLGGTFAQILGSDTIYPAVRSNLITGAASADEAALLGALPAGTVPTDVGSTEGVAAPSAVFRALDLIPPVADPEEEEEDFGDPPAIGFNSKFKFDFDPSNGIDADKIDFDATAVHEIGHALGFISLVGERELDSSVSLAVSVLDLFRFRPGVGMGTFPTASRVLSSGGNQRFFAGGDSLAFSTGRPDGSGGDGEQASHWKDEDFTGEYIGIMDPTTGFGERQVITDNDVAALDAIGYLVGAATQPPPTGNVAELVSGEPLEAGIPAPPPGLGSLGITQYTIEVPAGASQLKIDLDGNQDVDLFVRHGARVQVVNQNPVFDHVSFSDTGIESITIVPETDPPLRPGTYFIAVVNFGPGDALFNVTATVTEGGGGGGGSAPAISTIRGNLEGDNLGLIFTAADPEGDITTAQVSLLDQSNRVVNQPSNIPVNFGPVTQVEAQLVINNMNAFPAAVRARLVFIDAAGNRSAGATADFSQAQPGGVTISDVSLKSSKMILKLQGTVGTLQLEVNGVIVAPPRKIKTNSSGSKMTIKGKHDQLNVRTGLNRVRVKSNNAWSNISLVDN
jgi:hypothetical protein